MDKVEVSDSLSDLENFADSNVTDYEEYEYDYDFNDSFVIPWNELGPSVAVYSGMYLISSSSFAYMEWAVRKV